MTDLSTQAREMAETMDTMAECWLDGGCFSEADSCKEAAALIRNLLAEREATKRRVEVMGSREAYIFEYEREHGKGSFDATGE